MKADDKINTSNISFFFIQSHPRPISIWTLGIPPDQLVIWIDSTKRTESVT
jgi:hypothetical protein